MEFLIQQEITKADLLAYYEGFLQKKPGEPAVRRLSPQGMRLVFCLLLAGGAARLVLKGAGLWDRIPAPMGWTEWLFSGLLLGVGGYGLYRWRRGQPYPHWVEKTWRATQQQAKEGAFLFREEGFYVGPQDSSPLEGYECVERVWEDKEHFYLVQERRLLFLCKRDFVQGDPTDFAAFLTQKTEKPVLPVNPMG